MQGQNTLSFSYSFSYIFIFTLLAQWLISMIESRLFLLRDYNFIDGALSYLQLCRMFSFTAVLHTA